jgi:hypothetical protein
MRTASLPVESDPRYQAISWKAAPLVAQRGERKAFIEVNSPSGAVGLAKDVDATDLALMAVQVRRMAACLREGLSDRSCVIKLGDGELRLALSDGRARVGMWAGRELASVEVDAEELDRFATQAFRLAETATV